MKLVIRKQEVLIICFLTVLYVGFAQAYDIQGKKIVEMALGM